MIELYLKDVFWLSSLLSQNLWTKISRIFVSFLGLYAHKYEEEFQPYMQQFVTAVWNLLMNHGAEVKYDLLTSNAIQVQYNPLVL